MEPGANDRGSAGRAAAPAGPIVRSASSGIIGSGDFTGRADRMTTKLMGAAATAIAVGLGTMPAAQGGRPARPTGSSAVEVGGKYDPKAAEPTYVGGKWIEITYGRPIRRGREIFGGTGANYGKTANPDQPVWRAGANVSTQLKNEVPM